MNWITLTSTAEFDKAVESSNDQPVAILKHSTQCGMCTTVKAALDAADYPENIRFYLILVWENRDVSNYAEKQTGVQHESPQLLLYDNGKLVDHYSHRSISPAVIQDFVKQTT